MDPAWERIDAHLAQQDREMILEIHAEDQRRRELKHLEAMVELGNLAYCTVRGII